jgi:hypothetical protein
LAFLEAQLWKKEFGAVVRPPAAGAQPSAPAASPLARRRSPWRDRLATALAMAASFLVALTLAPHLHPRGPGSGGLPVAHVVPAPAVNSATRQPAWQMVSLASQDPEGEPRTIEVPAVPREEVDPAWLKSAPAAVPPEVLQAFQRTGHQVQQHRELLPVSAQDGRQLFVPVDQVEVHYVGRPTL